MSPEERFRNAGVDGREFRGAPFWSWNDDLEPEELRRQIRSMHDSGMGGFFMHTRIGLITPYLSERYMECHEACIDEARKLGMGAWLYDEDCWPSGAGGGIIAARGQEYQAKSLHPEIVPGGSALPDKLVATYRITREGDVVTGAARCSAQALADGDPSQEFLTIRYTADGYIDVLWPEAVKEFIDCTHELFKKLFKPDFGKAIPGIFTDEPCYHANPWSHIFQDEFKSRRGYDILDRLPAVFYPVGDYSRARYDYYRTAMELYVEAYSRQIGEWCAREDLKLTGHQLAEETLAFQASFTGAVMPHYEYMQIPGVDVVCKFLREPVLVKQTTSVADQLGKERVLSETFGCSGWDMTFGDQKWIGEWQYALGVNLMCQHLALYSLRGCRKRDYPPSIFYQQPWWPEYGAVEDHFARLAAAMTSGKPVADVLVIHPIESEWASFEALNPWRHDPLYVDLIKVSDLLLGMHYDYHYGDESLMEKYASVDGSSLRVGHMLYKTVVLPNLKTIRGSTLNLLSEWIDAGGRVIVIGAVPTMVEGVRSDEPARILIGQPVIENEAEPLKRLIMDAVSPRITVVDKTGNDARKIMVRQRDLGEKQLFFLANSDRHNAIDVDISIAGGGMVERWDLDSGDTNPVFSRCSDGLTTVSHHFEPAGSYLIALDSSREPVTDAPYSGPIIREEEIEGSWTVRREDPNALTMDYCRYQIGDGDWSELTQTIWLQDKLADVAEETPVTLRFTFNTAFSESKPRAITLVMEDPQRFEIRVNGQSIDYRDEGWWTDISFKKILIDSLVRPGENVIEITRPYLGLKACQKLMEAADMDSYLGRAYTNPPADVADPIVLPFSGEFVDIRRRFNELKYEPELESCYLTGDFSVIRTQEGFTLTDVLPTAEASDLVEQGYPFFAGRVVLSKTVEIKKNPGQKIILSLGDAVGAIVTKVRVNGQRAGRIIWRPMELDVTRFVVDGVNHLEIELIGSLRNLLGPHHTVEGQRLGVGQRTFKGFAVFDPVEVEDDRLAWVMRDHYDKPADWRDEHVLVPFGLLSQPRLRWERK